jgi:hypothetical protein
MPPVLPSLQLVRSPSTSAGWQFFIKVSYLFRFKRIPPTARVVRLALVTLPPIA